MKRRRFLFESLGISAPALLGLGCRAHQYGHVLSDKQADMVGSHAAGAETYNPLVDEAVAKLLSRQESVFQPASAGNLPQTSLQPPSTETLPPPVGLRTICFVGVENKSAEELGDFREQLYEQIDAQILASQKYQPISRRFVDAALRESRLRPDSLVIPENLRMFVAVLEQQGQPFDYLLYATITSGTTHDNADYQRDYQLTLELLNIQTGHYDKESAKIRKGYHKTMLGKLRQWGWK